MAKIEKKIDIEFFDAIVSGKKKYELRLADFDASEGDTLFLREYDPEKKEYTGRSVEKRITYVRKFPLEWLTKRWSMEDMNNKGLYIFSLD